jgi:hypothetical protein
MKYYSFLISLLVVLFIFCNCKIFSQDERDHNTPLLVSDVSSVPFIDGNGTDSCWMNISWQNIDQVWIPYNGKVSSDDYSGHYKVAWSSSTNLLYFLIEVKDDYFVDGYIPGGKSDLYDYDIAEVFIDEDASGGLHVFDGEDTVAAQFGSNAENAFTYHIYAPFPDEGQISSKPYVGDLAGISWANAKHPNYASHFPEFALRRNGNTAVWEFSLIVYNDTYDDENKDVSRSQLKIGKLMGLSLAYCDNDGVDENPKVRDNMFGSVWEPKPGNWHWLTAAYFGKIKLVSSKSPVSETIQIDSKK